MLTLSRALPRHSGLDVFLKCYEIRSVHIYKITHTLSGKLYVGKTEFEDAAIRWRTHQAQIKSRCKKDICPKLYNAMRKHGVDAFTFEVIETVADRAQLDAREIYWISRLHAATPGNYNLTHGGTGGKPTEEVVAKMRAARSRQRHTEDSKRKIGLAHKGRRKSAEERAALSAAHRGKKRSAAHKAATSAVMRKLWASPEYRAQMSAVHKGRSPTAETRAKLSAALKGKPKPKRRHATHDCET